MTVAPHRDLRQCHVSVGVMSCHGHVMSWSESGAAWCACMQGVMLDLGMRQLVWEGKHVT